MTHKLPSTKSNISITIESKHAHSIQEAPHADMSSPAWSFQEQTPYVLKVEPLPGGIIEARLGNQDYSHNVDRVSQGAVWRLNWEGYVGLSNLYLSVDGEIVLDLPVEVISRKLSYEEDYRSLLDELTDWLAALVFSYETPTSLPTIIQKREITSKYLLYMIIRQWMQPDALPAALRVIADHPHRRLLRENLWVDVAHLQNISSRTIESMLLPQANLSRHPTRQLQSSLSKLLGGRHPQQLIDSRVRVDFDTPENRFIRHAIRSLLWVLQDLEDAFLADMALHPARAARARELAQDCSGWSSHLSEMERVGFLDDVGELTNFPSSSQVLRKQEGYRHFSKAYQSLQKTGEIRWDGLEELLAIPSKDVPTLYEYWTFFAMADALSIITGSNVDWRGLVKARRGLFEIGLQKGLASKVEIGNLELYYNKRFSQPKGSYSVNLKPDLAIKKGEEWMLFDAKYRLEVGDVVIEAGQKEVSVEEIKEESKTYVLDDLYKMHTYRDAIAASSVFILYPGDTFITYDTRGRKYSTPENLPHDFRGIGAIPLLPQREVDLLMLLRMIL